MSSSVLNQRLRELRQAQVVAVHDGRGYELTTEGHALLDALSPLNAWAARWSQRA
jgi:DNA-binding HxlR family transcriptional regulator